MMFNPDMVDEIAEEIRKRMKGNKRRKRKEQGEDEKDLETKRDKENP